MTPRVPSSARGRREPAAGVRAQAVEGASKGSPASSNLSRKFTRFYGRSPSVHRDVYGRSPSVHRDVYGPFAGVLCSAYGRPQGLGRAAGSGGRGVFVAWTEGGRWMRPRNAAPTGLQRPAETPRNLLRISRRPPRDSQGDLLEFSSVPRVRGTPDRTSPPGGRRAIAWKAGGPGWTKMLPRSGGPQARPGPGPARAPHPPAST